LKRITLDSLDKLALLGFQFAIQIQGKLHYLALLSLYH